MLVITNQATESKRVVFEPGNATRYDLLLSKTESALIMTDLNERKVVLFNPNFVSAEGLENDLVRAGYSLGDARPMAEFLEEAFTDWNN